MDDLRAAASVAPDAILVPKVAQPGDIVTVAKVLGAIGAPAKTRLWAMMETPSSVLNAREIAALGADPANRLACLVMGTNDLLKESRARALHNRIAVVPWLAMTIVAARAYGLDILDGVYNDFRDEAGFGEECEHGRTLGMDGKTLIHPSQVGAVQRDLLAHRGGGVVGAQDHRGLRGAGERAQGRHHGRRADGGAAAPGAGAAHGRHRGDHRGHAHRGGVVLTVPSSLQAAIRLSTEHGFSD